MLSRGRPRVAASTTARVVIPKCSYTSAIFPDMPNVPVSTNLPSADMAVSAHSHLRLHCHAGRRAEDLIAIGPALLLEQQSARHRHAFATASVQAAA